MRKTITVIAALVLFPAAAQASISLNLLAGILSDSGAVQLPAGSTVTVIADTNGNGFGHFGNNTSLLGDADDKLVLHAATNGAGGIQSVISGIDYTGLSAGDELLLVWYNKAFNAGDAASGVGAGVEYNYYRDALYLAPADGGTLTLNFATASVGGPNAETDGQTAFSTMGLIAGDFDADGDADDADIDMYIGKIGPPSSVLATDAKFDFDADRDVDANDYFAYAAGTLEWSNAGNGQSGNGTLRADYNRDGIVDLLDLNRLGANWQLSVGWGLGDTNGDGVADLLDLNVLGQNWNQDVFVAPSAPSSVPEPAGLMLLGLGGLALARRRG